MSRRRRPPSTAAEPTTRQQEYLDLVDWRRRVGDLYRLTGDDALARFRAGRDALFRQHPQSPIPTADRAAFSGLRYFEPDTNYAMRCRLEPIDEADAVEIDTGGEDGVIRYRRAGEIRFAIEGAACRLTVFSLIGYGGGLFLPFRDASSGGQTYGGGRYLFDTVKNTDGLSLEVGVGSPDLVIDFNYAYNASCAYDARWACPLAPRENFLSVPIRAGEMVYHQDG